MKRAALALALALVLVLWPRLASAGETVNRPHPSDGFGYELRTAGQINPSGLRSDAEALYRHGFYRSDHAALARNGLTARGGVSFSPAFIGPTAALVVQPLSVLSVSVRYEPTAYFGAMGLARSYASPDGSYGRPLVSSQPEDSTGANSGYALWVHKLTFGASLQAQFSRFVVRSAWTATRFEARLQGGDRVLYDPSFDTLVYRNGWAIRSDTDAGFAFSRDLERAVVLGLRFTTVNPIYEAQDDANPSSRLGPWVRVPLYLSPERTSITATAIAQLYVVDRYHTGVTTPAAIPALGLVLTAKGDL